MVPGVNHTHAAQIDRQRRLRGWRGFIVPLLDRFGIERVVLTSMQGVSGAGRSPGVMALDIFDNVIPYIPGEEEKVARETGKILGRLADAGIVPEAFPVSVTC